MLKNSNVYPLSSLQNATFSLRVDCFKPYVVWEKLRLLWQTLPFLPNICPFLVFHC